jgi:hypothetical protein
MKYFCSAVLCEYFHLTVATIPPNQLFSLKQVGFGRIAVTIGRRFTNLTFPLAYWR